MRVSATAKNGHPNRISNGARCRDHRAAELKTQRRDGDSEGSMRRADHRQTRKFSSHVMERNASARRSADTRTTRGVRSAAHSASLRSRRVFRNTPADHPRRLAHFDAIPQRSIIRNFHNTLYPDKPTTHLRYSTNRVGTGSERRCGLGTDLGTMEDSVDIFSIRIYTTFSCT